MRDLYLIHGWTYSTKPWERTLAILRQHGVTPHMLHVPGLTSTSDATYTLSDYVAWAASELPDNCVVLGHSNGGRILLNLLADSSREPTGVIGARTKKKPVKNPPIRHLILLSSAGIYEPSKRRDLARRLSKLLSPLKKLPLLRKVAHKLLGASDYSRAPENMKRTLANMLDSDRALTPDRLKTITTPTSILWGAADTTTPLRMGQKLHSLLPHSTLEVHDSWTHAPYISDPEGLAASILNILDRLDTAKKPAKPSKKSEKPSSKPSNSPKGLA